jgi:CMP-N-acetylneuraminic acid synthetase
LIKASFFFKKNIIKAMLAIAANSPPIQWSFEIRKKNQLKPLFKNFSKFRSQDIPKTYYDTGTFGAFKSPVLEKKSLIKYFGFIIPKHKGIDIDTMEDWLLAEKIFKRN